MVCVPPFGKPTPRDPTRAVTTLKTAWANVRANASVRGRWHDNGHTLITDLAESGAGDQTIMDIAGHVSKQMLKHYSHIRMEAKRRALESIVSKKDAAGNGSQDDLAVASTTQHFEGESLQSAGFEGRKRWRAARKSLKRFGSPPWTHFELSPQDAPPECFLVFFRLSPDRPECKHEGYHQPEVGWAGLEPIGAQHKWKLIDSINRQKTLNRSFRRIEVHGRYTGYEFVSRRPGRK
jgi:hypothetical protein